MILMVVLNVDIKVILLAAVVIYVVAKVIKLRQMKKFAATVRGSEVSQAQNGVIITNF
jgi:hypothetical protein